MPFRADRAKVQAVSDRKRGLHARSADPEGLETLTLAERIARDTVQEVAEWSVLYSKELPET